MHRHSCALQELLEATSGPLSLLAPWLGALALDPQRTLGRITARTARPAEAAALLRTLAQVQRLCLGFSSMLLCMREWLPSRQCTGMCACRCRMRYVAAYLLSCVCKGWLCVFIKVSCLV